MFWVPKIAQTLNHDCSLRTTKQKSSSWWGNKKTVLCMEIVFEYGAQCWKFRTPLGHPGFLDSLGQFRPFWTNSGPKIWSSNIAFKMHPVFLVTNTHPACWQRAAFASWRLWCFIFWFLSEQPLFEILRSSTLSRALPFHWISTQLSSWKETIRSGCDYLSQVCRFLS